ncbi:MAG: hypothetical protein KI792_07540 [Alphaproteobacteria bacterium]|nr:hypothetical protein [Alphaproteobacteria bacterium SS10]
MALTFRRDYPIMLGPDLGVIADIACVELALIITVEDDVALKRMSPAELEHEAIAKAALEDAEWLMLNLWYRDVMERMDGCLIQIDRAIMRAREAFE